MELENGGGFEVNGCKFAIDPKYKFLKIVGTVSLSQNEGRRRERGIILTRVN